MINKIKIFLRFVSDAVNEKKELEAVIVEKNIYLKSGYYHLGRSVGYHVFEKKPPSLVVSKGSVLSKVKYPLLSTVFFLVEYILPPILIQVKNNDRSVSASQLMLSREGDIKVFDYRNQKVLVFPSTKDKYIRIVNSYYLLSLHLPIVNMEINNDNKFYTEALAQGITFSKVKVERQFEVVIQLLDCYLSNSALHSFNNNEARNIFNNVIKINFESSVKELLKENNKDIVSLMQSMPLIFSHCDLFGNNIIVDVDSFKVIDIEKACIRPVFFDVIHLVVTEYFEGNKLLLLDYVSKKLRYYFKGSIRVLFLSYLLIFIDELSKESSSNTVNIDNYKLESIFEILDYIQNEGFR